MGIFVGLIVHRILTSQRRYEQVVNEIYHNLLLHADEITIKIESNRFIQFQALYGSDPVFIPLSVHYLHSQFYRVHGGTNPPEDVKQFANILWESLNIFKEHYPAHIELNAEGLDHCEPFYREISTQEALRRQVSCVASRSDEGTVLFSEELDDILFVLYSTVKAYDIKSMMIVLDILNSNTHCPAAVFKNLKTEDLRLFEAIKNDSDENINARLYPGLTEKCKSIVTNVIRKILVKYPERAQECQSLQEFTVEAKLPPSPTKYEIPCSLTALMFQITETTSLERATFLLESLNSSQAYDDLVKMRWGEKLKVILEKYCEKIYTCDNYEIVKYGVFHYQFLKALLKLSRTSESFVNLLNLGYFDRFYELVEEACRLLYQIIIHKEDNEDCQLYGFIDQSLKLIELIVNPAYYKFLRPVNESLNKVLNILNSFTRHVSEECAMPAPEDPEELKMLSPQLFEYKNRVSVMITKIEALLEYQERHEEKYARLFSGEERLDT